MHPHYTRSYAHYMILGQHIPIQEYSVFLIAKFNAVEVHCYVTDSKGYIYIEQAK